MLEDMAEEVSSRRKERKGREKQDERECGVLKDTGLRGGKQGVR